MSIALMTEVTIRALSGTSTPKTMSKFSCAIQSIISKVNSDRRSDQTPTIQPLESNIKIQNDSNYLLYALHSIDSLSAKTSTLRGVHSQRLMRGNLKLLSFCDDPRVAIFDADSARMLEMQSVVCRSMTEYPSSEPLPGRARPCGTLELAQQGGVGGDPALQPVASCAAALSQRVP